MSAQADPWADPYRDLANMLEDQRTRGWKDREELERTKRRERRAAREQREDVILSEWGAACLEWLGSTGADLAYEAGYNERSHITITAEAIAPIPLSAMGLVCLRKMHLPYVCEDADGKPIPDGQDTPVFAISLKL